MSDALTTSALPTSNRPKLPVQEDNEDSGIVCYEHCGRRFFVLSSLVASASCPTCSTALSRCQFGLPPFAMPQPFESAADRPMCLVIKPTGTSFLSPSFSLGVDLHVGVTDSAGRVHEFGKNGVRVVGGGVGAWRRCVVVDLRGDVGAGCNRAAVTDPDFPEYWDSRLRLARGRSPWSAGPRAYDETRRNCLDFCLSFLSSLPELGEAARVARHGDKVDFCRRFVTPRMRSTARYIMLHRKLRRGGGILELKGGDRSGNASSSSTSETTTDEEIRET